MTSRRRQIISFLVDELKNINGQTSTFDSSYTYKTNIFENAFRRLKFINEVNDFPSIYLSAGRENRDYQTQGLTLSILPVTIRGYVRGEKPQEEIEKLIDDIEHIVYALGTQADKGIQQIRISNIVTDEGLIEPYGILEVFLTVEYEIQD